MQTISKQLAHYSENVARKCSVKKMFLEIPQNSQENTCARVSFLIKLPATSLKRRPLHKYFPVNFAKILGTPFYKTPLVAASDY